MPPFTFYVVKSHAGDLLMVGSRLLGRLLQYNASTWHVQTFSARQRTFVPGFDVTRDHPSWCIGCGKRLPDDRAKDPNRRHWCDDHLPAWRQQLADA